MIRHVSPAPRVHDRYDPKSKCPEGYHADLLILALVRAFDDRAIEYAHRINEGDSMFSAVSRILSGIPFERHLAV